MNQSDGRKRVSPEYKQQIIDEFISSSLTIQEICAKHDVKVNTFRWWCSQNEELRTEALARSQLTSKKIKYTFEQRKAAVEAYLKSGMTCTAFAKTYGVSVMSISVWTRIYQNIGPQGLETEAINKFRGRKPISESLKKEIIRVKSEYPDFGLRKVRDFLKRFKGVKVSHKTIGKTLVEGNIPLLTVVRKRRRSSDRIRRFERAKPMQLWQSDITSYVLTRHNQRVYLTVFLDDHSRYAVAWNLQLRQTNDLVIDALLGGIQKFGKPEEVLTDQGRQYFSWRGRSDFRKQLDKEGIQHVVSRSHHPQTLGKCERLWETIKNELWDRAKPQELGEARERLKHFFDHYNHFRPHQGLDGMTPADRFFGLENEIRKKLEETIKENALRLAVGDSPRVPVFLVGQIGDQSISLHGESGQLVINTPDGETHRVNYKNFGHNHEEKENGISRHAGEETGAQERELQECAITGGTGEGSLGSSVCGRETKGATSGDTFTRVLDGSDQQAGACGGDQPSASENMAIVATGDIWDACGTAQATQANPEGSHFDGRRKSEDTEKENLRVGKADRDAESIDSDPARDARLQGCDDSNGSTGSNSRSEEAWPPKEESDTDGNSS